MAEIQTNDHGEGGKNKQKKQHLRVDFTPMVDMNMLLITFFMLCTSLIKPSTMNINMPAKDETMKDEEKNKVQDKGAITLLLGADNKLFYYEGMLEKTSYDDPEFLIPSEYGAEGIRQYLLKRNAGTYEKIQELKVKLQNLEITDEQFRDQSKEIQENAMKKLQIAPTVMIKPTDLASYKNLVDALDEMLVCNIGTYAIMEVADGDRYLLFKKTENSEYLTEAQKNEAK
jgi:biopolymer transport protein ExbD